MQPHDESKPVLWIAWLSESGYLPFLEEPRGKKRLKSKLPPFAASRVQTVGAQETVTKGATEGCVKTVPA
jgi:hypothetical protein